MDKNVERERTLLSLGSAKDSLNKGLRALRQIEASTDALVESLHGLSAAARATTPAVQEAANAMDRVSARLRAAGVDLEPDDPAPEPPSDDEPPAETEEPPTTEPPAQGGGEPSTGRASLSKVPGVNVAHFTRDDILHVMLAGSERGSSEGDVFQGLPFTESFVQECQGVREWVVVLHNGDPRGEGMIRLRGIDIREPFMETKLNRWTEDVSIEPGGMLTIRYYEGIARETARMTQEQRMKRFFWGLYMKRGGGARGVQENNALMNLLDKELNDELSRPVQVGPYDVIWDREGYGHGGQGICPDRLEWRRSPAGLALIALEAYRVANRLNRCMTDSRGRLTWDPETAYSSVGDFMPDMFEFVPETDVELAMKSYRNIDGQHFERAFLAACFMAEETGHLFSHWFLDVIFNFQAAVNLGHGGDHLTSHWWSLEAKIASQREKVEPRNQWCGRQGVHECRFARRFYSIASSFPELHSNIPTALKMARLYEELFEISLDDNGVAFAAKASTFTSSNFPDTWGNDPSAQAFELQLAFLMYEDSWSATLKRAAPKLASYLTDSPPYSYNWRTGAMLGKAHPYFELSTHGHYRDGDGSMEELLRVSIERIGAGGVEAGGANPLNYLRPSRGVVAR